MDRAQLLALWKDMWLEGNWVPSWPDSLAGVTAQEAVWTPSPTCHCIWQEVVHATFWRRVTLERMAGGEAPGEAEIEAQEFALPAQTSEEAWAAAVAALQQTQEALAAAIEDESKDIARIPYHLIHDAYHLGRITQLRQMQGTAPKF